MDIDAFLHSPKLHNKILQELNLVAYGNIASHMPHQVYIFEKSNCVVKCYHVLIFLRQSTCYGITLYTHQWYEFNANEILKNHKPVLSDDQSAHMLPLSPAEPPETHAFMTIAILT